MNADQARDVEQDIAGKLQEEFDKLFGSSEQQDNGFCKQIFGNSQKTMTMQERSSGIQLKITDLLLR
jgi:hypothetical protein